MLSLNRSCFPLLILLGAVPVMAERANFETLTLASGFNKATAIVRGYTSGSYSLSSLANSDRDKRPCIGYGDPNPDHILILENDFPKLALQVNSGGKDTTLVIRGPDQNTIRCNFSASDTQDARIEDEDWKAGRYEVWVGSMAAGQRLNYRLSAQ
ncbi:hypothetical protein HC931_05815 [Candidatus Gracilibacteria bacterium]|jgi:hypothetical protein|nr:hypothetical protein [Candidatus Gracilibacteria bacterium]NJM87373.1 hypothetical protein [Hydrococcus sp. RU_2_2]NJP21218.1 hypothetical protein [Hydrococcus sp. CRU_1_1]